MATTPSFAANRGDVHDGFRERLVVRFLAVEPNGAVMANAKLTGSETLPTDQCGQAVNIMSTLVRG